MNFCRKLRGLGCFLNFDRVRGWFDTEFQDNDGFTVSSLTAPVDICRSTVLFLLHDIWFFFLLVNIKYPIISDSYRGWGGLGFPTPSPSFPHPTLWTLQCYFPLPGNIDFPLSWSPKLRFCMKACHLF